MAEPSEQPGWDVRDDITALTADQIMEAIAAAIKDHNFKAVTSLIRLLAVKDPHAAELAYESIKAGLAIRRGDGGDKGSGENG